MFESAHRVLSTIQFNLFCLDTELMHCVTHMRTIPFESSFGCGKFTTLDLSYCSNLQTLDAMLCELVLQIAC
jgi:hypothetical protein